MSLRLGWLWPLKGEWEWGICVWLVIWLESKYFGVGALELSKLNGDPPTVLSMQTATVLGR